MTAGDWAQRARREMDNKTKPPGSLGRLESLAVRLASIQQTLEPEIYPARVLIFAADHGIAAQGVSAYPAEVTAQMMANFVSGGAAINVIAESVGASIEVIDAGVNADLDALANITHRKTGPGTGDISLGAAMTPSQCAQALDTGRERVHNAYSEGIQTIALGEMGIANTSSATALICALTGKDAAEVTGRGTGIDDAGLGHKRAMIRRALEVNHTDHATAAEILHSLGGFEIAAMAGAMMEAALLGRIVLIDGFISTAAALCASRIEPACRENMVFSHRSAEPGHRAALEALDARPLLDLDLCLGEGTGAALAIPLLHAAAKVMANMATFESAGVSGKFSDE